MLQGVKGSYKGLEGFTGVDKLLQKGLPGVRRGYRGLQGVTTDYRRLQEVTRGCRELKEVTTGNWGL